MDAAALLKGVLPDAWYKVFVYVGIVGFFVGLTVDVKGITNNELIRLSLGLFFFGVGFWFDMRQQIAQKPNQYLYPGFTATVTSWQPSLFGVVFVIVGIVLTTPVIWTFIRPDQTTTTATPTPTQIPPTPTP